MSEHFFIVGAQRSGTTYLYHILAEHPNIEMARPVKPEPKFFYWDHLFARGVNYYLENFFSDRVDISLRGEKSTSYFESEKAAQRIARTFPQAKILIILRQPIERAVSNYWFSVNSGFETLPMEEAFLREEERRLDYNPQEISVSPFAYLQRGRYIDYLLMYETYFSRKNIKVILYEQLVGSETLVYDLYKFLGVSAYQPVALHTRVNQGNKPDIALPAELRHYLLDYFADPNARLAEHLDISLSEWK